MAMRAALADAGLAPADIGYINLHGTGTRENDQAEAKAIKSLFDAPPPLSSIKGATGHSLAASGAIEAVVSALIIGENFLPGNIGCRQPDPALGITPVAEATRSGNCRGPQQFLWFRRQQRFSGDRRRRQLSPAGISGNCGPLAGCARFLLHDRRRQ